MNNYIKKENVTKELLEKYGVTADVNGVVYQDGKPLVQFIRPQGSINKPSYARVYVLKKGEGDGFIVNVHTVITTYFMGNNDENLQVDHINGNPCDNRLENLRLCTASENCRNKNGRMGHRALEKMFRSSDVESIVDYIIRLRKRSGVDVEIILCELLQKAFGVWPDFHTQDYYLKLIRNAHDFNSDNRSIDTIMENMKASLGDNYFIYDNTGAGIPKVGLMAMVK